jgi:hypothetical protein
MSNDKDKQDGKKGCGCGCGNLRPSNDQLGENAGEGRLSKEQKNKQPKK